MCFCVLKWGQQLIKRLSMKTSGLIELLKNRSVLVEITKVSYGDYIINDVITVERKTAKDFLISI